LMMRTGRFAQIRRCQIASGSGDYFIKEAVDLNKRLFEPIF